MNFFRELPLSPSLIGKLNPALFKEITGRQEDFVRAFNNGDASGAADIYDPDGFFMPQGRPPLRGRAGIEAYFKQDMSDGVKTVQIITEEVNGANEWAFERGSYHLKGPGGHESGAYLLVWKKIDGRWSIHNDCFNVIKSTRRC